MGRSCERTVLGGTVLMAKRVGTEHSPADLARCTKYKGDLEQLTESRWSPLSPKVDHPFCLPKYSCSWHEGTEQSAARAKPRPGMEARSSPLLSRPKDAESGRS